MGIGVALTAGAGVTAQSPPVFTPVTAGVTIIRAVHLTELRSSIDTLRVRFGLVLYAWTDVPLTVGTTVRAIHVTELRGALTQAYAAAARTPPSFTDASLTPRVTGIRAIHLTELQSAVAAALAALPTPNQPPSVALTAPPSGGTSQAGDSATLQQRLRHYDGRR